MMDSCPLKSPAISTCSKDASAATQVSTKTSSGHKISNARIIKSRFREAAAKVALDGSSGSTNSSAHTNEGTKGAATYSGCKSKSATAGRKKTSGTCATAKSLTRDKIFASSLTLDNAKSKRGNSNYNDESTIKHKSLSRSASLNIKNSSASNNGNSCFSKIKCNSNNNSENSNNNSSSCSKNNGKTCGSTVTSVKTITPMISDCIPGSVSSKLHSTAVNMTLLNTTLLPSNTTQFSSTVLSQRGHQFCGSLLELPDLSVIRLDGRGEASTSPLLAGSSPCEAIEEEDAEVDPVTAESLELDYLNYLTWCHLTASATAAHTSALQPAMREVRFLSEAVLCKEREASDLRQRLQSQRALHRAANAHAALVPALQQLNDGAGGWQEDLHQVAGRLEHHLHQVTLAPAVLPDSAEEVIAPLQRLSSTLTDVLQCSPLPQEALHTADSLLDDVQHLTKCCDVVQEAACLVLQKCSLQISAQAQEAAAAVRTADTRVCAL